MIPERLARRPLLEAALVYAGITLLMGRHVLASIGSRIASDPGDPLLTTAILTWNATHVPWTQAWYQFPIFYPTPDALALSEHLLGISVIAAPIQWLTGSPVMTYNLTALLSYPLCGLAMFALIRALTNSSAAAVLAGTAYAFAPFRASHLPHIQMLAAWGMPLALLGLHRFLESRHWKWLVVFGVSWVVQGAANGYYLVYFTGVVVLWVGWFMAARGRWRDVAAVVAAMIVAVLPLAPVLYRYLAAQHALGLSRGIGEMASYSADIAALFCAPDRLTFWGWLRVGCVPEGELFPGTALVVLCVAGAWSMRRTDFRLQAEGDAGSRLRMLLQRVTLLCAGAYAAIAVFTFFRGPWQIDFPLRASASTADKPASVTLVFLLLAFLLSRRLHTLVRHGSTSTFYLLCAVTCWVFTWGPFPKLLGDTVLYQAPYAWLRPLPGFAALRAPSRLWMMAVLCLVIFMALGLARLFAARTRRGAVVFTTIAACALAADGFTTINAADIPPAPLVPPSGETVLLLPVGQIHTDISAVYHSVLQGYRSINGYSGYEPPHYEALRTLSDARDPRLFLPFVGHDELHVLVPHDQAELRSMIAAQPGAQLVLEGPIAHYRIPARQVPAIRPDPAGTRLRVQAVEATCAAEARGLVVDGNLRTRWVCGVQSPDQALTADLGAPATVGAIVHALGSVGGEFPRLLTIETSMDGSTWMPAWEGSPAATVLAAAMAKPLEIRPVLAFAPRTARYVRLRQLAREGTYAWSLAELEVWSGQQSP
jgi:hypothetical protein